MAKNIKIALDAGHGLSNRVPGKYDTGMSSPFLEEASEVLAWAITGKYILNSHELPVFLTRVGRDDSNPVGTRDDQAKAAKCTHFVSLHVNASDGRASGYECFIRDQEDKPLAKICLESMAGAGIVGHNRGIKSESDSQHGKLAVLSFPGPACLFELGFGDYKGDAEYIKDRLVRIAFWEGFAKRFKEVYL